MNRTRPLILDVDDDDGGRYAVGRVLRQAGFDVLDAQTGKLGLDKAREHHPDLILLDIRLPDIDGFEVCRMIRDEPKIAGIPVLQMSASYLDVSSRVKGLDNGADAFLTKPAEPAILVATIRSLLRLKNAENKVQQTAREWQATFDAIADGVALLDLDGQATRSNHAYRNSPKSQEAIRRCFEQVLDDMKRCCEEVVVGDRSITITIDPVLSGEGELTGAVCVLSDITEKKRFEAHLQQAARLESIGVLAGGIAHDFNNLLTGILGNSSLLRETLPEDSPDLEMVEEIVKASESAASLTRQILAYSGKGRFVMKPLAISELVMDTRGFVRRFIPAKVEATYDAPRELPMIMGDSGQMQQLLMNLIINAAESFEENQRGLILVKTGSKYLPSEFFTPEESAEPGEYVLLSVMDNGSGMAPATQARIFDPFFTTKFTGRGLGLSAVHGILKAHRGLLRLDSKPGEGTCFRLYFPSSGPYQEPVAAPKVVVDERSRHGLVLVMDDESTVRTFARSALELRGYEVLLAENGKIGIEIFARRHKDIQLVILDYTMPVMSGAEALEELRKIRSDVPVILSSGFSQATAAERFQGKGLAGFLGKPFTVEQLTNAVDTAIKDTQPKV